MAKFCSWTSVQWHHPAGSDHVEQGRGCGQGNIIHTHKHTDQWRLNCPHQSGQLRQKHNFFGPLFISTLTFHFNGRCMLFGVFLLLFSWQISFLVLRDFKLLECCGGSGERRNRTRLLRRFGMAALLTF